MMKKLIITLSVFCASILGFGLLTQPVWADGDICSDGKITDEALLEAAGCKTTATADSVINNVLSVVTGIMGLVAVGAMIYGGVIYIISNGDSSKITQAKHIIIYGLIGLVVSLLAFTIVRFVSGVFG